MQHTVTTLAVTIIEDASGTLVQNLGTGVLWVGDAEVAIGTGVKVGVGQSIAIGPGQVAVGLIAQSSSCDVRTVKATGISVAV
jgi:hypothetical protein